MDTPTVWSMEMSLSLRPFLVALATVGLAVGFLLQLLGRGELSEWVWTSSAVPVLLALFYEIVTSLRRGDLGLDIIAALSMTAALLFGEELTDQI